MYQKNFFPFFSPPCLSYLFLLLLFCCRFLYFQQTADQKYSTSLLRCQKKERKKKRDLGNHTTD